MIRFRYFYCTLFHLGISRKLDVVIALDGSQNVDRKTFDSVKEHVLGSLNAYDISENATRISVVTFGAAIKEEIELENGISQAGVQRALSSATVIGGRRDLPKATSYIKTAIFEKQKRPETGRIMILFIAGATQQGSYEDELKLALEDLEHEKVNFVIIAVGDVAKSGMYTKMLKDDNFVKIPSIHNLKESISPMVDASGRAAGIF